MQPKTSDGYQSRWRHFHPQSTVWVQNPFDHDVVFQVADERNTPYQYKLPAHKVSELPGGAVATLGVKAIVDELIQNNKDDVGRLWDQDVRAKHEDKIILRLKEASVRTSVAGPQGEIDLSISEPEEDGPTEEIIETEETAFPGLQPQGNIQPNTGARSEVTNIASASLAGNDVLIEDN